MTGPGNPPLVTIVTIAKNNQAGLLKTLESIKSQDFDLWSLVIVVGDSTDRTLELAQSFVENSLKTTLMEQQDSGIYEAMNLGMTLVETEFVWFMNSGDVFYDSESLKVGVIEAQRHGCSLLIGHHRIQGDERKFKNRVGKLHPLSFAFSRRGSCHQAMIFKTSSLDKRFTYNANLKYCADYSLALSLVANNSAYRIKDVLCEVEPGGVSDVNLRKVHSEKHSIRSDIFGQKRWLRAYSVTWIFLLFCKVYFRNIMLKFKERHSKS